MDPEEPSMYFGLSYALGIRSVLSIVNIAVLSQYAFSAAAGTDLDHRGHSGEWAIQRKRATGTETEVVCKQARMACFFCKEAIDFGEEFRPVLAIQDLYRLCPVHTLVKTHRICFLWNIACFEPIELSYCSICRYTVYRVRNAVLEKYNLVAGLIEVRRLGLESRMLSETNLFLPRYASIIEWGMEHFEKSKPSDILTICQAISDIEGLMPVEAVAADDLMSKIGKLSPMGLFHLAMEDIVSNDMMDIIADTVDRNFYERLPSENILAFFEKMAVSAFHRNWNYTAHYRHRIDTFVLYGLQRLSSKNVVSLFSHLIQSGNLKLHHLILSSCKMYRIQLSSILIFDIMFEIAKSDSVSYPQARLKFLIPLITLFPSWLPDEKLSFQTRIMEAKQLKRLSFTTFFKKYISDYSDIPHILYREDYHHKSSTKFRLTRKSLANLLHEQPAIMDILHYFSLLQSRPLPVILFDRAISNICNHDCPLLLTHFLASNYLQVEYFWNLAVSKLSQLSAVETSRYQVLNLLPVLLAADRCTPEKFREIIEILQKTGDTPSLHYCIRIIMERMDFPQLSKEFLWNIFQVISKTADYSIRFRFLMCMPENTTQDIPEGVECGTPDSMTIEAISTSNDVQDSSLMLSATQYEPRNATSLLRSFEENCEAAPSSSVNSYGCSTNYLNSFYTQPYGNPGCAVFSSEPASSTQPMSTAECSYTAEAPSHSSSHSQYPPYYGHCEQSQASPPIQRTGDLPEYGTENQLDFSFSTSYYDAYAELYD